MQNSTLLLYLHKIKSLSPFIERICRDKKLFILFSGILITLFFQINNIAFAQPQTAGLQQKTVFQMNLLEELDYIEELIGLQKCTSPVLDRLTVIENKIFGKPLEGKIEQRINTIRKKLGYDSVNNQPLTFKENQQPEILTEEIITKEIEQSKISEQENEKSYVCKGDYVTVKKGYRLQFAIPESEVKPHKVDDTFELKLVQNYKVDGQIVFKKGSIVQGKVTKVKTSGKVYESGILAFDYLPYKLKDGSEIRLVNTQKELTGPRVNDRVTAFAIFGVASILMWPSNEEISQKSRIWGFVTRKFQFCIDK